MTRHLRNAATILGLSLVSGACSGARTGDSSGTPDASAGGADASSAGGADAAPGAPATPVINEFMRKPPEVAGSGLEEHEFIEIAGDPDVDYSAYWILQVRGSGDETEIGTVRTAHQIGATDGEGLWSTGYLIDTLKNNTYTLLLVENYQQDDVADFDLDSDNDGVIDSEPWTVIADSVAYQDDGDQGAADRKYSSVVLTPGLDGNLDEWEGASRAVDGVDSDMPGDWVRNDPDGAGLPGFAGTVAAGEAVNTMGAPNEMGGGGGGSGIINEFVFNHAGADTSEFIEILAGPSSDLSGHTLVVIDGDAGSRGVITAAIPVGSTDGSGFWTTDLLANELQNSSQTILLVAGFQGAVATDLDTDDDGVLDAVAWDAAIDAVAVTDGDVGDLTYLGAPILTPDLDGGAFTYGGASRLPSGTDSDAPGDWLRNDFDGEGLLDGVTGTADATEALNTPGAANVAATE